MVVHSDKMVMKKSASWALDLADELRGNPLAMGESIENMSDFLGSLSKSKIIDLNRHCLDVVKVVFFFIGKVYIDGNPWTFRMVGFPHVIF